MKHLPRLSLLLFISVLQFHAQNLLNNGTFEFGGSGVGFVIDGNGYNLLSPPYSGSSSAGNYAFVNNPQTINTQFFQSFGDHTSGSGLMMVIDGTTTGGQQRFWKAGNNGGGVCNLVVGQTYTFSYWIRTASNSVSGAGELANIGVQFNNASNVTLTFGSATAPIPNLGWQQVRYSFTPTNACVNIELFNNNTNAVGNDFAIDDMSLNPPPKPLDFTYSITQPNCSNPNSGLITLYPRGGQAPYIFQLQGAGPIPTTNDTGVFDNLPAGSYTIGLQDANGTIVSESNVVVNSISPLVITPGDTVVCPNASLTFTASGGGNSYTWSSSPLDLDLSVTNQPTINVSPNNSTTYTVTSNVNVTNMIYNGDFELGNEGFATQYEYLNPTNPTGAQRTYGIVTNSNAWYNQFANCIDHTLGDGTGKMMVVDGSTFNLGNDKLWCQKVAVEPNKDYLFSYRIMTVSLSNNAKIRVEINGQSLGVQNALNINCAWNEVNYVWNSGNNLFADICLIDQETSAAGNDFALDDISFRTNSNCTAAVRVTMVTVDPYFGFSYPLNICPNEAPVSPSLEPTFQTGGIFSADPQGLNINPITGVITPQGTTPGTYNVNYTAQICGQNATETQVVVIRPLPGLLQLTGGDFYCEGQAFNPLELVVTGTPNYTIYYNIDGVPQVLTDVSSSPIVISIGNQYGVYDLDSITDAYCSNIMVGSQTIAMNEAPVTPILGGDTLHCKDGNVGEIFPTNITNGEIRWYGTAQLTDYLGSNQTFLPNNQTTTTYYATNFLNGCESPAGSITIYIEECPFIIPTAFTPNGDGTNDYWNIIGLDEKYPLNHVTVYNRWGEAVYESLPGGYNQKPFDGKFKGAMLPSSSYYYVIKLSNEASVEPLNGTVSIILKK